MEYVIYTDGASRGNPGPAAIGVVIKDGRGEIIWRHGRTLGVQTNNFAEYTALIVGLEKLLAMGARRARVLTDSELMVRQVNGIYKVKNEGLKPLHERILELRRRFQSLDVLHVPREENKEADKLANAALDGKAI